MTTGDSLLFPDAVRRLVAARRTPVDLDPRPASLTRPETEVLRLVATGLSNTDIAADLVISLETVKTHVGNIFTKLGATNRSHAVIVACESGLVTPRNADAS